MAREQRTTHPILGPSTWRQIKQAANEIRSTGRRLCTWCHGDIPKRRLTQCGSTACDEGIHRASDWNYCKRVAMKAAHGKCRCGAWAEEVDHIIPVSLGGTDEPENLRPLCHDCHKEATARLRREKALYVAA